MIPNCPGAITLDTLVFFSGHKDRLPVPLVMQSTLCIVLSTQFSGKFGELHLWMLFLVQLVKAKCLTVCQYYAMVLRYVLPINMILDLFSMLWITVFVRYSTLN